VFAESTQLINLDIIRIIPNGNPIIDVNQFSIITELLGTPPDDVIKTIGSENVRSPFQKPCAIRKNFNPRILTWVCICSISDSSFCPIAPQERKDSIDNKVP